MGITIWSKSFRCSSRSFLRLIRITVAAILLIGFVFTAAVPITTVSSSISPGSERKGLHEDVPISCTGGVHTISMDTNWLSGNVYKVTECVVIVSAGVTLTVEAGAVVKFSGTSSGMRVDGSLMAEGTSELPVTFTSLKDDTGGDTNADGSATTPAAGDWYGIVLAEASQAAFDYSFIGYGGANAFNGYLIGWNRAQLDVFKADVVVDHSEISNGTSTGIYLETPGRTPSIQNTAVLNHSNGNPADLKGSAIFQSTINMQPTYSNLTFSGNDYDEVVMETAEINQNVILGGAPIHMVCGYTDCAIGISAGLTVAIQPGAILDMTNSPVYFLVRNGGSLIAEGTEEAPIMMIQSGVIFEAGSMGSLAYCDISGKSVVQGSTRGVYIQTDGIAIRHCNIHNHYSAGIETYPSAGMSITINLEDVHLDNNGTFGMYLLGSSGSFITVNMDGGSLSNNKRNGLHAGTPSELSLSNLEINGNGTGSGYTTEQNGIYANSQNVSLSLENIHFLNNVNEVLVWYCNGSITAKNLTVSGNGQDRFNLVGCVITTGREWDLGDAGLLTTVTGAINVDGGVLSLAPGTRLGFVNNTSLNVYQNSALYALGTADEPIVFTRASEAQTPATAWRGLSNYKGTMILRHCEVSYSNYWSSYGGRGVGISLTGRSSIPGIPTNTIIQNCKIHDNEVGIYKSSLIQATTSIIYNEIYNNPTFGIDWGGYDNVNAYYNYWGAESGPYHATLNPEGEGNKVDDNVNFIPFLTEPPEENGLIGEMMVNTGGPAQISPGEVNYYAVQYLNLMTTTVEDALIMIQLPVSANYISSTDGGIYWPARHQVFWKLGDLTPGSQGMVSTQVRFDWGLPASYSDGSLTYLVGSNYKSDLLELSEYDAYVPDVMTAANRLTQDQYNGIKGTNSDLQILYDEAIMGGYVFIESYQAHFDDGTTVTTAMMRTVNKQSARAINLAIGPEGTHAQAITSDGKTFFTVEDTAGGETIYLLTLERVRFGAWAQSSTGSSVQVNCNYARCMRNCSYRTVTVEWVKGKAQSLGAWLLSIPTGTGFLVGLGIGGYEVISTTHDFYVCHVGCWNNPLTGCCTAGEVIWQPGATAGNKQCSKYACDTNWVDFSNRPDGTDICGFGFRCVAGINNAGGCKPCIEESGFGGGQTRCTDMAVRQAKDPNALYGPAGDVLPTDTMHYRITYENEGSGSAFGVYILNNLPEELDENTLFIDDLNGYYVKSERQLVWYIGELGPKDDPSSLGEVTYSAALKAGLPAGTEVVNQATVYFPSVPEETPTNSWTNLVYPLVATPQEVETDYMTSLGIVLSARPDSELTFNLETLPRGGTLEGTLPNLIYTPMENFTGPDYFTFSATKAGETSAPAQVSIQVNANGDTTPPVVTAVAPEDGAQNVGIGISSLYTIKEGLVFAPVISIGFSEALQEESVTDVSILLRGPGGELLQTVAWYEPASHMAGLYALEPLLPMTEYEVVVTTGVKDLALNALENETIWHFTTGLGDGGRYFLPIIIQ